MRQVLSRELLDLVIIEVDLLKSSEVDDVFWHLNEVIPGEVELL